MARLSEEERSHICRHKAEGRSAKGRLHCNRRSARLRWTSLKCVGSSRLWITQHDGLVHPLRELDISGAASNLCVIKVTPRMPPGRDFFPGRWSPAMRSACRRARRSWLSIQRIPSGTAVRVGAMAHTVRALGLGNRAAVRICPGKGATTR
jgi:hypothetical protein